MATTPATIEVFAVIDGSDDYAADNDEAAAVERYEETVQELAEAGGFRLVKLTLKVPLPTALELAGEVAVEETAAGLAVA